MTTSMSSRGAATLTDSEMRRVSMLARRISGIALKPTKGVMVRSRLASRLRALGLTVDQYLDLIEGQGSRDELQRFINAISTNKTDFFRESHHFEILRELLFEPAADRSGSVRIWSAAASTGVEAYSIAMTAGDTPGFPLARLNILGTDINTEVLERARRGVYRREDTNPMSEEALRRWFEKGRGASTGRVRVKQALRDRVRFERLNLMQDHWPIRPGLDAIFCRNVLIYFDEADVEHVLQRMAGLLAEGGLLFLGHAERLSTAAEDFTPVGTTAFRKTAASTLEPPEAA